MNNTTPKRDTAAQPKADPAFHRLAEQEEANQPDGELNLQRPAGEQPSPTPPAEQPPFQVRDLNEQEEY